MGTRMTRIWTDLRGFFLGSELIQEISEGKKYMKAYKQMKMYNDPSLNPVLYSKKN